jgi:1-phosphofructokinase
VFVPAPILTVMVEREGDHDAVHLHAGGQGIWEARMLVEMGVRVRLCAAFGGETGRVVKSILLDEGFDIAPVERASSNPAYVHDRRGGERTPIAETPDSALTRHELDALYDVTLREGMAASLILLSGPPGEAVPADTYRRLTADFHAVDAIVMADLSGARLDAVVAGGVDVLKVSDEELVIDGRITSIDDDDELLRAMLALRDNGARRVIVSRAERGAVLLDEQGAVKYSAPEMEVVDTRGAGDSLTGACAAQLATGASVRAAMPIGVAAGALNVTRHGLGSGDRGAILALAEHVTEQAISMDHL